MTAWSLAPAPAWTETRGLEMTGRARFSQPFRSGLVKEWRWVLYPTLGTIFGWNVVYWIFPDLKISFVLMPMPIVLVYLVRLILWGRKRARDKEP